MIVEFDKSFLRYLNKIKDVDLHHKIASIIYKLEEADVLSDVKEVSKLTGFRNYYKIRIGDYRLGFEKLLPKNYTDHYF